MSTYICLIHSIRNCLCEHFLSQAFLWLLHKLVRLVAIKFTMRIRLEQVSIRFETAAIIYMLTPIERKEGSEYLLKGKCNAMDVLVLV